MADMLTLGRSAMKDRSTAHLRIYVGGIMEDDSSIEEVYNHFIPYGPIDGIIINRMFGFVQFRNESSAQDAISKADGSIFKGRKLNVKSVLKNDKLQTEVVVIQPDVSPAVAMNDNLPMVAEDNQDDPYDNQGNYVGEKEEDMPEEIYNRSWNDNREPPGMRGRGRGGPRGRGRGRGAPAFRDRSPGRGEWQERDRFERYPEYPRKLPVPERNDCEIIVVSKMLTEYAEYIEGRLKRLGIVVDLLFPMEDVPIGKVLGNIASRGCLYAILVMPENQEHRSMTLTILHGLPQEHRNMPLEDALQLISRNYQEVQRGGASGREAVYALLGQMADGRNLTVLQYDKVLEYLKEKRAQQVKIELGEPLAPVASTNKTQVDLQQRILSILNDKKEAQPPKVTPPKPDKTQLLNDPTVRKALDSILHKFV
ncbi:nuclear receptor coactivator 5 [Pieris rapae]|uniref:nuclear receptor coactivator 5 n=1 Tax=Pieris rapae TaxID=64459 RepID=UPI001E28051F|nr:nuclear receptor coactivator 5 [Pieris rapae]